VLKRALLILAATISANSALAATRDGLVGMSRTEQLPHVSIRDEGGVGTAVILVPGLSTSRAVWDGLLPLLKAHHRVFTVQVNGFGGDDPRSNLGAGVLEGIVADVAGYVLAHRLNRPALIGHSLGGLAGLMPAKEHPGRIGRLLVIDALPYIGDAFRLGVTVPQVEPQARAMRDRIASAYGKPRDPAAAEDLAETLAVTVAARRRVKYWILNSDPRVASQAMYEDMTTDLRTELAGITLPITLLYPSDGDKLFRTVYSRAPNVTYDPVKGSGHFVMLDQPEASARAIEEFLR
jgi:pimeloyl-ACP methyl ester carboxylesterase